MWNWELAREIINSENKVKEEIWDGSFALKSETFGSNFK